MAFQIPPPPEGRFGKWAYLLWDYVAKNRLGAAAGFVAGTGILVGTGTTSGGLPSGTYTVGHATSGVAAGTYGASTSVPQLIVDARGHVTSATEVSISNRAVEGVAPIAVATTAGTYAISHDTSGVVAGTYGGTAGIPRFDLSAQGHVLSGTNIALQATSPIVLSAAAGTMMLSHATGGLAAGSIGAGGFAQQFTFDAQGHVTANTPVGLSPYFLAVTGAADGTWTGAYTGAAGPTAWAVGAQFSFFPPAINTGAVVLTITGTRGTLTSIPTLWDDASPCLGGEFLTSRPYNLLYDGTSLYKNPSSPTETLDLRFRIRDNVTRSKQAVFVCDAISTGTTESYSLQGYSGTLGFAPQISISTAAGETDIIHVFIPAWASAIELAVANVGQSGGGNFLTVRAGTGAVPQATGYSGVVHQLTTNAVLGTAMGVTGFDLALGGTAVGARLTGSCVLRKLSPGSFSWQASAQIARTDNSSHHLMSGTVALAGVLGCVSLSPSGTAILNTGGILTVRVT